MAVDKEYWNRPNPSDDFLTTQGTNITVFVDHADNSLILGLETSDVISVIIALFSMIATVFAVCAALKANKINMNSLRPFMHLGQDDYNLTLDYRGEGETECVKLCLVLKNIGNGPLIIRRLDLTIGNTPIIVDNQKAKFDPPIALADYASNVFRKAIGDSGGHRIRGNQNPWPAELVVFPKGTGLAAGENVSIVSFPIRKTYETPENRDSFYAQIKVSCEYEDIYGNTFIFKES